MKLTKIYEDFCKEMQSEGIIPKNTQALVKAILLDVLSKSLMDDYKELELKIAALNLAIITDNNIKN